MVYRYILIFFIFYAGTFFLDAAFSNWFSRFFAALFGIGIVWLLQPVKKKEPKQL